MTDEPRHDPAEEAIVAHMQEQAAPVECVWHEMFSQDGRRVHVHLTEAFGDDPANQLRVLFTTGMSDLAMPVPDGLEDDDDPADYAYAELMVSIPADFFGPIVDGRIPDDGPGQWLVGVLQWLARLPWVADALITPGVHLGNGAPPQPFEPGEPWAGVFIAPPAFDEVEEGRVLAPDGRRINLYGVMMLYPDEVTFLDRHELDAVLEHLPDDRVLEYVDVDRPSFAPNARGDTDEDSDVEVAFVITEDARIDADALVRAAAATGLFLTPQATDEPDGDGPIAYTLDDGTMLFVTPIAAPHPEADQMPGGPLSLSPAELAQHGAHVIVSLLGGGGSPRDRDRRLAQATAAVVRASSAVGAMFGRGVQFYKAELFADLAEEAARTGGVPVEVAVDVTVAPEPDERMSFLTHGLARYGREEFYLTCPQSGRGALEFLLGLVRWMVDEPDKTLPTGDTVGRTAEEKIEIQRVPHPAGGEGTVIRLDL